MVNQNDQYTNFYFDNIELGIAEFDISLNSNYTVNHMNELVFEKTYQETIDVSLWSVDFPISLVVK